MGAGHASTSIGYALGMKEAMRRGDAPDARVVAVIGDGAMTGAWWRSTRRSSSAPTTRPADRYVTHGKPALLHEEIGFTPQQIAGRVEAAVLDPRRTRSDAL
jgi:hypothetical protein